MGFEGEVPPEVTAEYKRMEEAKSMETKQEVAAAADKEADIGSLQAGVMSPEDFVKSILAREGGDSSKVEAATRSLKFSWLKLLEEGRMSAEDFNSRVYEAVVKMLKKKEEVPTEKEKMRQEHEAQRMKDIRERKAA